MTAGPMDPALWQRIVDATAEVERVVAAVPAGAHLGADGMTTIRAALEGLRAALVAELPERTVYAGIFPLVLYIDELVAARLGGPDAKAWQPLQREIYGAEAGAAVLDELVDRLLADASGAQLTIGVLLYCLRSGLAGGAAADPEARAAIEGRLARAIERPALPLAGEAAVVRSAARPRSALLYYAASALVAAGAAAYLVLGR